MKKSAIIFLGVAATTLVICGICLLLYSNSSGVLYEKGLKALLTGRYDDAQEYMQRVVDKNDARRGDAYYALAQCCAHQGDSVASADYLRLAALDLNRSAISEYLTYLDARPQLFEQYTQFIAEIHEKIPEDCQYASRLAKLYLYGAAASDRAGELLQPFISQSGTDLGGADITAKALAAHLLLYGSGGYVQSPEAALFLAKSCRQLLTDSLSEVDGDALYILGKLELVDLAYTPEANMLENLARARRYFKAINASKTYSVNSAQLNEFIQWLDSFLDESARVQHSPSWWNRQPNDWTSFFNRESGFRYIGHTNGSGDQSYNGFTTEYPLGWGCGAWTREHNAAVGKWGNNGHILKGIYVYRSGSVELLN